MVVNVPAAAARAAAAAAARLGITCAEPVVLADGANVIVHLSPAPVVAKVAASTPAVRPDTAAWLQRELDLALFLTRAGAPVLTPSREVPGQVHTEAGHVMSFWTYLKPADPPAAPDETTIGAMLRDLHAVLATYPVTLPALAPLGDIPAFLARPRTRLSVLGDDDAAVIADTYARLTQELTERPRRPQRLPWPRRPWRLPRPPGGHCTVTRARGT